jgi:NarL family two-component system response regulator LiaR
VRVLVVDDHDLFRSGLRALLEEEGFRVIDVEGGAQAVRRVSAAPPDVVLMDLNMPEMSGVEATRELKRIAPGVPVIMLTVSSDDDHVLDAVRAGAAGYLLKDAALDDIATAIRAAAAGGAAIAPRVAGGLLALVRREHHAPDTLVKARPWPDLSPREREILAQLTHGAENADIARRLHISLGTVKNHVSTILQKLGVENRVQAAVYAIRHDLVDGDVND